MKRYSVLAGAFFAIVAALSLQTAAVQAATFTVTNLNDSGAGSLRQAIIDANASAGSDTITFGVVGRVELASALPAVTDSLTIVGPGATNLVVDGNGNGPVFSNSSTLSVSGITVTGGAGAASGGGFSSTGTLSLDKVVVTSNSATSFGGGIHNAGGSLTVTNSTISSNHSDAFAGGVQSSGTLVIGNSTISGNTSDSFTGGVHFQSGTGSITKSTVSGNSASSGGGLYFQSGSIGLINVTISGNTASSSGGGIYNQAATSTLTNVTMTGNQAPNGASIYLQAGGVSLLNTIVANSIGGTNCNDDLTSLGHNLDDEGSCGLNAAGDINGTDPQIGALANNGGPTLTHAIVQGGPAFNTASADCGGLVTDQRGVSRPQFGLCDIGAFELAPPPPPPAEGVARGAGNLGGFGAAVAAAASQQARENRARAAAVAPTPAVAPPRTGTGITPPSTGDAGLAGQPTTTPSPLIAAVALTGLGTLLILRVRLR